MRTLLIAALLFGSACARRTGPEFRPREMELWYWHHSYLTTPGALRHSEALADRAARAGYTGLMLWDSSLTFLNRPDWPPENVEYLRRFAAYAQSRGLQVVPIVAPYGSSIDVLRSHPDWAEGQRVVGSRFRVAPDGRGLIQVKSMQVARPEPSSELLRFELAVTPWRQYHIHFNCRTRNFHGLSQITVDDGPGNRLDANLHPASSNENAAYDYTFNSAESSRVKIAVGAFGPHEGELQVSGLTVEETALVYVLRRPGTPLRVYDPDAPDTIYREGADFDPIHDQKLVANPNFEHDYFHDPGPVTLPVETHLRPGQEVAIDYYAIVPVYDFGVGMCLTELAVRAWVRENARRVRAAIPHAAGLLMSYDEMWHMNSCALCRAKRMSAGELLAANVRETAHDLSGSRLYAWSDMFDPRHNARDHYYHVEGDLAGSWRGLDPEITVMNWNHQHLADSLRWFSGDDARQPVPHRQIIAGFYDPPDHDGAAAARREMASGSGIPGIVGMMFSTWADDYSQLENYGRAAREAWNRYRASSPL